MGVKLIDIDMDKAVKDDEDGQFIKREGSADDDETGGLKLLSTLLIKDENNKRVEVCPDLNLELTISLPHHNHQSPLTSNNNNGGSSTAGDGYDFLGLKSGTVLDCRSSITQIDWRALKE